MSQNIIYVAGNPSAYPIEYYDAGTESYRGMLPDMLGDFAEQYGYDIRYYKPGAADKREELSEALQVDLISGCASNNEFRHNSGEEILFFESEIDGAYHAYYVLVSGIAPKGLGRELREYASGISRKKETGMLISSIEEHTELGKDRMNYSLIIIGFAFTAMIVAFLLVLRKYRHRVKKLEQIQETDELTGIGNLEYLNHYIKTRINDKNRVLYGVFYFYVDVDRIERIRSRKEMNTFLCHTANVLMEYASDYDILARVSDDGFVLLHQSLNIEEAEKWLLPALERIRKFNTDDSRELLNFVASGVYFLQADDWDLNEILFNAAQSAQFAYHAGKPYQVCTNDVLYDFSEDKKLQSQIMKGLENDEFVLYIQFYVDASTHEIVGGEALSRWNHPEKGLLSPGRFVPLMEREEIVDYLDYYSLNKVCAFLEKLKLLGINDFFVSCNFSRETFSSEMFLPKCREIIEKYNIDRDTLIFELTESVDIKDFDMVIRNIKEIKNMGIRIALDDFGDGFTSFFDIQEYPIDGIKLDKSLVDNLGTNPGDIIIGAMIDVGHKLGITVLGEGVENDAQAEMLKDMGCDVIQGFRFHYPIPEWEAIRKLGIEKMPNEEKKL